MPGLGISDVAERTGLAPGTIRAWEQRHGFPAPRRTPAGHRVYSDGDVEILRRVVAYRAHGLSVPAALSQARDAGATDRPSLYGALVGGLREGPPLVLERRTLLAISRAIEDETLARAAAPVVIGAFQRVAHFRAVEHRYRRLAQVSDACVAFADFPAVAGGAGTPWELPIAPGDALGNEWAVVVDAPGYSACLLAWETPGAERRFEALWTLDPHTVRRAALVGAALAARVAPAAGERVERVLADRPLATAAPAPALTALANRIVAYMDAP